MVEAAYTNPALVSATTRIRSSVDDGATRKIGASRSCPAASSQGWASSTKMPWKDAHGRTIGTFGLTRDVTTTKDAEEKLK